MIKVYSVPNCKYCEIAKKYLTKHNIDFEDINLKLRENGDDRKFYRNLDIKTAPIITGVDKYGEEWILTEYDEKMLIELLEK